MVCKYLVLYGWKYSYKSDCTIHKSAISQEKLGFFVCWYRLRQGKRWFGNLQLGWVKNILGQSVCGILKTAIRQKRRDNQRDILYVDRDSGKVNGDLNNFGKIGS